jgi:Fe-S-cluster-containing hydrogenase component 2
MKKRIRVNAELCNGCRICATTCSMNKSGEYNLYKSGIWIESDDATGHNEPVLCRQCRNPVCVRACPAEKAWRGKAPFDPPIWQDDITGIVWLDSTKESCLGCNECLKACPFGAIRLIPGDLNLVKCDLCGGEPECVTVCPKGAIEFVEVTKMSNKKKAVPGKVL